MSIEQILKKVSEVTDVSIEEMKGKRKDGNKAIARGVFFAVCKQQGISGASAARALNRTSQCASTQSKVYQHFYDMNDKLIVGLIDQVNEKL